MTGGSVRVARQRTTGEREANGRGAVAKTRARVRPGRLPALEPLARPGADTDPARGPHPGLLFHARRRQPHLDRLLRRGRRRSHADRAGPSTAGAHAGLPRGLRRLRVDGVRGGARRRRAPSLLPRMERAEHGALPQRDRTRRVPRRRARMRTHLARAAPRPLDGRSLLLRHRRRRMLARRPARRAAVADVVRLRHRVAAHRRRPRAPLPHQVRGIGRRHLVEPRRHGGHRLRVARRGGARAARGAPRRRRVADVVLAAGLAGLSGRRSVVLPYRLRRVRRRAHLAAARCRGGHRRLGRRLGCRDDRVSGRDRCGRTAASLLQRQRLRPEWHRGGRRGVNTTGPPGGAGSRRKPTCRSSA